MKYVGICLEHRLNCVNFQDQRVMLTMGSKTAQKGYQDLFVRELDSLCHTCSVLGHFNGLKDWYFQDVTFLKHYIICMEVMKLRPHFHFNVLTNQFWFLIFSILLSSLALCLLHTSSLWLTSLFVHHSSQSLQASAGIYLKKQFLLEKAFIIIICNKLRARFICVLHVVAFPYLLHNHSSNKN